MKRLKTFLPFVFILLLLLVLRSWNGINEGTDPGDGSAVTANDRQNDLNEDKSPFRQAGLMTANLSSANEITKIAAMTQAQPVGHEALPAKSRPTSDLTRTTDTDSSPDRPVQDFVEPQELMSSPYGVLLQAGALDSRKGPVNIPEELRFDAASIVPGQTLRYLVQFTGPVQHQWKEEIKGIGGSVGSYIPNNTFIVAMTEQAKEIVGTLPYVQWIDYFHPAYKLATVLNKTEILDKAQRPKRSDSTTSDPTVSAEDPPSAIPPEEGIPIDQPVITDSETVLLMVQTFQSGFLPYLYTVAESIDGAVVLDSSDNRNSRILLEVPAIILDSALITLAQASEIEWIEPYVPPSLNNDEMHWVVQSNSYNSNPLWSKGLTGTGQIVGVGDTGLDVDMAFFWDGSQGVPSSFAIIISAR